MVVKVKPSLTACVCSQLKSLRCITKAKLVFNQQKSFLWLMAKPKLAACFYI